MVGLTISPWVYGVAKYKGYIWKGLSIYVIFKMINAIYDCGIYARFFVYGPGSM